MLQQPFSFVITVLASALLFCCFLFHASRSDSVSYPAMTLAVDWDLYSWNQSDTVIVLEHSRNRSDTVIVLEHSRNQSDTVIVLEHSWNQSDTVIVLEHSWTLLVSCVCVLCLCLLYVSDSDTGYCTCQPLHSLVPHSGMGSTGVLWYICGRDWRWLLHVDLLDWRGMLHFYMWEWEGCCVWIC